VQTTIDPDAEWITAQLRAAGTPERAASAQNYLKSTGVFSGTTVPAARAIITDWRRARPELTGLRLAELAAALWAGPVFECKLTAVILLTDRRALLAAADARLIESFLRTAGTWALVDGLAADVMGSLVERAPELLATLDRWAADDDFWIRRSALLSLLVPLRRGDPTHFARFGRYADAMLAEREFFIRKAIGWVLRETGKRQPDLVADWLAPRAGRASGVTMREAVKWLPPAQRDALMAAYRARNAG
jgi:3-methyladenine DNA glycosylase AlkD